MRDFAAKVAVVTGGASGIGYAVATRFAQEGMKVVLADVEEPALEAAVTRLRQAEHDVIGVVTDVSKAESVEALRDRALEAFGKVHIVHNNAGVGGSFGRIWESSLKDWEWTLDVNLWGVVHGMRTFVPLMLDQGEEGHIVNTASIAGLLPGTRIYSVTKHAVVVMTEALYYGLQEVTDKVHASVLCPGLINTNIMFSYRNRPSGLQDAPGVLASDFEIDRSEKISRLAQERGLPPEQLADIVLDGVRNERFYILTHDSHDEAIRTRMEDILQRRNPSPYHSELDEAR